MDDYYKILNVSMQKKKGTLTDEMVEQNYSAKREQYLKMENIKRKIDNVGSEELQALLEGRYLELLENAYYAIRTENARKHYDELCAIIEKYKQELEQAKNEGKRKEGIQEEIKPTKQEQKVKQTKQEARKQAIQEEKIWQLIQAEQAEKAKRVEQGKRVKQALEEARIGQAVRAEKIRQAVQAAHAIKKDKIGQAKNNEKNVKKEEKEEKQAVQKEKNPIQNILKIINKEELSTRKKIEEIRKAVQPIKKSKNINNHQDIER